MPQNLLNKRKRKLLEKIQRVNAFLDLLFEDLINPEARRAIDPRVAMGTAIPRTSEVIGINLSNFQNIKIYL